LVTYTVPGMKPDTAQTVIALLQDRLNALNDLALTLKHVHWNVVGPNFIAVHTMLDPQMEAVRAMVDETAERIATLGGSPSGTPGALVSRRGWDDYSIGRASTLEHSDGSLTTGDAKTERSAAKNAKTRSAARRASRS
jgi:starvation-inducible DNA-binding protein